MPRTYKPSREKNYRKYDEILIEQALIEYNSTDKSLLDIAQKYNISKSVLYRHNTYIMKKQGGQTALAPDVEEYLLQYINVCSETTPLKTIDLRLLIKGYLDNLGIAVKRFKNNMPGPDYIKCFLNRHKSKITSKLSQNIKRSREAVCPEVIKPYFDELEVSLDLLSYLITYRTYSLVATATAMVNYCCVQGCGRNSRLSKHLNYYSLPKERHRQIEWLKAAQREDLLKTSEDKAAVSYRFCSRHFPPSSIKNRHLSPVAVPSLCLPGSCNNEDFEPNPPVHNDIVCDNCGKPITGFRYKCVNCDDFDLCQKCEMLEAHPDHYMLRMPKPLKYKVADNLIKKWRHLFKKAHATPNSDDDMEDDGMGSSDDEPITKYANNYDSGIDLSQDDKLKIRTEINRTLKINSDAGNTNFQSRNLAPSKKRNLDEVERFNKRRALEETGGNGEGSEILIVENSTPDVVFADVNEINDEEIVETNDELTASIASILPNNDSPVVLVKISDDISQLMIFK